MPKNLRQLAGGSPRAARKISSFLDSDNQSKRLNLRHFQKSGREFTGFQKKCKAKFSGGEPESRVQSRIQLELYILGCAVRLRKAGVVGVFPLVVRPPSPPYCTL